MANGRSGVDNPFKSLEQQISQGVQGLGMNLERNFQNVAGGTASLLRGDTKGFMNTVASGAALFTGAGLLGLVNPEDIAKVAGKSNKTINEQYATDAAAQAQQRDVAVAELNREMQVQKVVAGLSEAQKRAPGRNQTLLTSGSKGNTLLTLMGSK